MTKQWACMLGMMCLLLSGCSSLVDAAQPAISMKAEGVMVAGQTVGQTFVAQHAGLNGIEVWISAPTPQADGSVTLHLRSSPTDQTDLRTVTLPIPSAAGGQWLRFTFEPLPDSHTRYYYFFVESSPEQGLTLAYGPAAAYLDGAAYLNGEAQDIQVAFHLVYDTRVAIGDLLGSIIQSLPHILLIVVWLLLPGGGLMLWFGREAPLDWFGWLVSAAVLSLSLAPILLLLCWLVGARLGPWIAWGMLLGGLAAIAWRLRRTRPQTWFKQFPTTWRTHSYENVALMIVVGLAIGVRLLVVRNLPAPLWGDSYQHAMMVQLVVDHGGLFSSWEPYAALQSLTYHFGFHGNTAMFHWLTGIDAANAVTWMGQILNGLAVLALYPLAVQGIGSRWAGVGAVLLGGLLSPMPMFYVNWGRYTQLNGQVLLPIAMLLTWLVLDAGQRRGRLILLNTVVVGGLALTHYRILIFYAVFVLAWGIIMLPRLSRETWLRLVWLAGGTALIFLPWFIHLYGGRIIEFLIQQVQTPPAQITTDGAAYNAIGDVPSYLGAAWWLLSCVGIAVGLWQRRKPVAIIALWSFLMFLIANPALLGLPGTGAINNFAIFIAAYIPASLMIGLLVALAAALARWRWAQLVWLALLIVMGVWGFRWRMAEVRPVEHALLTWPDMQAMTWIQHNLSPDANFLVNSIFVHDNTVITGSDGGWWLPLAARRANTAPPLNYETEQGPFPNYIGWVNALSIAVRDNGLDHPDTLAMLRERGITHIYIGQRRGQVGNIGAKVLDPGALLANSHFRPIYHQDLVWIFELVQ